MTEKLQCAKELDQYVLLLKLILATLYSRNILLQIIFTNSLYLNGIELSRANKYKTDRTGIIVVLMSFTIVEIALIVLYFIYRAENTKRDRETEGVQLTANEELTNAFSDLTDKKNKAVRYKL